MHVYIYVYNIQFCDLKQIYVTHRIISGILNHSWAREFLLGQFFVMLDLG